MTTRQSLPAYFDAQTFWNQMENHVDRMGCVLMDFPEWLVDAVEKDGNLGAFDTFAEENFS